MSVNASSIIFTNEQIKSQVSIYFQVMSTAMRNMRSNPIFI